MGHPPLFLSSSYTIVPITSAWTPNDSNRKDVKETTQQILQFMVSENVAAAENEDIPLKTGTPKIFVAILIVAMIIMTTVGNAMVCSAVMMVRKLKHPQNFLLVSLAVADFFVGFVVMPLALIDLLFDKWPLGRFMCTFYTTADLTLCTASIVNLCAISVDRYLVIAKPLRYSAKRTTKRIMIYISFVWIVAAIIGFSSHAIANFLDDGTTEDNGTCQVIPHFVYQIYATTISFYGPTLIMVILNIKIWRAAKRLANQDRLMSHCNSMDASEKTQCNGSETNEYLTEIPTTKLEMPPSTNSRLFKLERKYLHRPSSFFATVTTKGPLIRQTEKSECKARKTLGVIMSVFIICWLPFFCVAIIKSFYPNSIAGWFDLLTLWLGYSNSTLNPLIYCKYNKEFRIPFREMLACRCSTLQTVMRQQSFTSRYGPPVDYRTHSSTYRPLLSRRNDSQNEASDV